MTDPNIDRLLAKRYLLRELIGTGAMGKVYRAKDILLGGVPVAVKFLSLSIHNQTIQLQERFEREAKTCALLGQKSIHIVRVMDYGVDENSTPFYVMEYLKGKSLSDVIRSETLSLARFLSLARQISLGLQCAHQGISINSKIFPIIHRDIKPSNVVIIPNSSFAELAKILDFGIAKLLQPDGDRTSYYMGTFAYSSPEQMEGNELDNRSDIYSLGVMMFEMLTGKMPLHASTDSFGGWYKAHHSASPRSFDSVNSKLKIPSELKNLVMSCLAKAPGDRPQSVSEIIQTLVSLERQYITLTVLEQPLNVTPAKGAIALENQSIKQVLSTEQVCRQLSWPQNKPIADIIFSHSIRINNELMAALWLMLPQQEIHKRIDNRRYNQFLFLASPHPMMLWITVLYSYEQGPKWLPYYLDLKTSQGQETTQLLAEKGYYRLLLFARDSPDRASACLYLNIAPAQCQLLQEWIMLGQTLVAANDPQFSKSLLKQEFEKLKPQILTKLEARYSKKIF